MAGIIVWDIETVPDLKGFAAANGLDGSGDDDIRAAMGDKSPNTSTTRSSALEPWSPTGRMVTGPWLHSARRTSASAPKRG
jgi:hypothetical protein